MVHREDMNNPYVAVYGYYSEEEDRHNGAWDYLTYNGSVVRVTTVVSSHNEVKNPKAKFIACLAELLGRARNVA